MSSRGEGKEARERGGEESWQVVEQGGEAKEGQEGILERRVRLCPKDDLAGQPFAWHARFPILAVCRLTEGAWLFFFHSTLAASCACSVVHDVVLLPVAFSTGSQKRHLLRMSHPLPTASANSDVRHHRGGHSARPPQKPSWTPTAANAADTVDHHCREHQMTPLLPTPSVATTADGHRVHCSGAHHCLCRSASTPSRCHPPTLAVVSPNHCTDSYRHRSTLPSSTTTAAAVSFGLLRPVRV